MTNNLPEKKQKDLANKLPDQHYKRSLEEIKKVARSNILSMPEMPETIKRKKVAEKNIGFIQDAMQKVKVIFPLKDGKFDPDCVPVKAQQDGEYLGEVYDGWQRIEGEKAEVMSPAMTDQERQERKVSYSNDGTLLRGDNSPASTIGSENKGLPNCQAFVLDKEDNLYLFDLEAKGNKRYRKGEEVFTFHGSALGNKPAASAGLMSVVDGKVKIILDRSGHYKPDKLDMYRGVKVLEKYNVLHEDCNVMVDDVIINHRQFIAEMEQDTGGIPLWQKLTNDRVKQHEEILQGSRGKDMRASLETSQKPSPSATAAKEEPFLKKGVQGRRRGSPTNLKFNSGGRGL